tara:strand:- start:632 stop:982 length:351 start_codon:yes stop_codon:yes gene_type:complete
MTEGATERLPAAQQKPAGTLAKISAIGGALIWSNHGLPNVQGVPERLRNRLLAQILNVLGSNRLQSASHASELFRFESFKSGRELLNHLNSKGCRFPLRCLTGPAFLMKQGKRSRH